MKPQKNYSFAVESLKKKIVNSIMEKLPNSMFTHSLNSVRVDMMANPDTIVESINLDSIVKNTIDGGYWVRNMSRGFICRMDFLPLETLCKIADQLYETEKQRYDSKT